MSHSAHLLSADAWHALPSTLHMLSQLLGTLIVPTYKETEAKGPRLMLSFPCSCETRTPMFPKYMAP